MFLQNLITVASQAGIMLIIAVVGYILFKAGLVDQKGINSMINVLLWAVVPAALIKAFSSGYDASLARSLIIFAAASVASMGLAALFAALAFRNKPDGVRSALKAAAVFSNCGFMGLPLVEAFYGSAGVMFASVYIAVFNLVLWSYGYALLSGKGLSLKKLLVNPGLLALAVSLPFFIFNIRLPGVVSAAVGSLASIQTPLAMLVIGAQLASAKLLKALGNSEIYAACFLKLIAVPALVAVVLWLVPVPLDSTAKAVLLIETAAPTAATVALLGAGNGKDGSLAGSCVAVTTLFSILTLPLCVLLADRLF